MDFLPRTMGTRPRLACEVRPEGVVAARAEEGSTLLAAVSHVELAPGAALPQLRSAHGIAAEAGSASLSREDRSVLVDALRRSLESVAARGRETTLIVPDSAVRVLLLDFDALPGKLVEALPIVRFRLKKLLPFDADNAAISYQVMSSARGLVRVLAVAIPGELLTEYESVVREAGFEPGAVLPSTLAAVAGLPTGESATLVINAGLQGVTTAITRGGVLLLHRTVDLSVLENPAPAPLELDPAYPMAAAAELQAAELGREVTAESATRTAKFELTQAVSVAAAYYEDTLGAPPPALLAGGTLGAEALSSILAQSEVGPVPVDEMVDPAMLATTVTGFGIGNTLPLGWLAGVRGALAG